MKWATKMDHVRYIGYSMLHYLLISYFNYKKNEFVEQ